MEGPREASRERLALLGIGLAVVGAIWGVAEVTGGSGFELYGGYTTVYSKLLPTIIAAALFGLVIGAGMRLVDRQKDLAPIGYLTVLLGLLAFAATARSNFRGDFLQKDNLQESSWIAALAAGQVSLLLSWPRPGDRGPARAVSGLAALVTIALAVVVVVEITVRGPNVDHELFGVLMVAYLLALVLVPLVDLAFGRAGEEASPPGAVLPSLLELDHASIAAGDRASIAGFYEMLLGADVVALPGGDFALRNGRTQLNVVAVDAAAGSGPAEARQAGAVGLSFLWPGNAGSALEMVQTMGAAGVSGPVDSVGARGPASSVFCRDPEGNSVELISYG